MSTDNLANMLSQIKNASMVGHESVELPYSKMRVSVLKVLEKNGFIKDVKPFKEKGANFKSLHVGLVYDDNASPRITDVSRISKLGRRKYITSGEIKPLDYRHGILVISTSRGVMSGEEARKKSLGGEVICEVK